MKKIVLLFTLFIIFTANAQHTIDGTMKPVEQYSWSILYKLNGLNQKYVADSPIKDGKFSYTMPANSEAGIYRVMYDTKNNIFIDFIFNNENIIFEFHPKHPKKLVTFSKSEENKLLTNYMDAIMPVQQKLDSLQLEYIKIDTTKSTDAILKQYSMTNKEATRIQKEFNKKSEGKLASSFIKSQAFYYPDTPIKDVNEYMTSYQNHFFDFIDFNDAVLAKSSVLINSVVNFVMHTNTSKDPKLELKLRKEAIDLAMSKINNLAIKTGIIKSLMYSLASTEELELTNYLFKNHFDKLPNASSDHEFKSIIYDKLKTTIGNYARDIVWTDKGEKKSLYDLKDANYYLVTFWSSTCGHCLKEMPLLQKFIDKHPEIKVVAIGLENEDSKAAWKEETYYYEDFVHVLALGKYQVNYVQDYGIDSTPNFFLLDKNKKIIAKPYDVKAIEELFPEKKAEDSKKESKETSKEKKN